MNVLVVEDDPEINALVGAYARLAGFDYQAAHSGREAFESIRHQMPDLMVLDLMLPDVDGLEICRQVKEQPATCNVPVIILTALDNVSVREHSQTCGAAEYMTKPFDPDELMRAMVRYARPDGKDGPKGARSA